MYAVEAKTWWAGIDTLTHSQVIPSGNASQKLSHKLSHIKPN